LVILGSGHTNILKFREMCPIYSRFLGLYRCF
jgi:hypothetical protein